jgi:hypothetical protein
MFAVMTPLETPEPARRVILADELRVGMSCPVVRRGDSVTFDPELEV